jgi:hypothetical protein
MLIFLSTAFPIVLLAAGIALERFERQLHGRDLGEP